MKNVMKGLVLTGVLAIGVFGMASCGNNQNTNSSLATQESIELRGTLVHPTPPSDTDFLLKMEKGTSINITSTLISLEKYFNQEVIVNGYYKNDEKTVFEVLSINENLTTNTNQNFASDSALLVYANNTLGVRFQYPSTWEIKEKDSTKIIITTKNNKESVMELFRIVPKVDQTLSNWIGVNYKNAELVDTEFAGIDGMRVSTDDSNEEIILLAKNNYFYTVHFKYSGKELDQNLVMRQFAELGNSFQFFVPGTMPSVSDSNQNMVMNEDTYSTTSVTTGRNPTGVDPMSTSGNKNQNSTITKPATGTLNTNQNSTSSSASVTTPPTTSPAPANIISYLKQNNYMLPQGVDSTSVSKLELAAGKYVYVTYQDGENTKKVAYSYADNGDGTYSVSEQGLFQIDPATSKWTTLNGVNPAPNSNREVYSVASGTPAKAADVAPGKNLYANDKTGVKVEFPNNWYYEGATLSEKGGVQQVTFSSKPLDQDPEEKVILKVYTSAGVDLSKAQETSVSGVSAYQMTAADGTTQYAVKGSDGKVYVTTGGTSDHMAEILKSVSK